MKPLWLSQSHKHIIAISSVKIFIQDCGCNQGHFKMYLFSTEKYKEISSYILPSIFVSTLPLEVALCRPIIE